MKRLIFTTIMAVLVFSLLNFVYCNLDETAFGYDVAFKFRVPMILDPGFVTKPLPMGFILLAAFSLGMIFVALLEAIPSIYKSLELRSKNKRIRELERELTVSRQLGGVEKIQSNRE